MRQCRFAALTLFGALILPSRNYCLSLLSPSPPRSFRPPIHSFVRPSIHLLVHQFLHSSPIRTFACQSIHLSTRSSSHSCMNESFIRSFLRPSPPPFPTFLRPLPSFSSPRCTCFEFASSLFVISSSNLLLLDIWSQLSIFWHKFAVVHDGKHAVPSCDKS